jgi:Autotransporter beta-domain
MKSFYSIPNIRLILFTFLVGLASTSQVMAAACSSSASPYAVDCDGSGVIWTTGPLVINSGVTLLDTANFVINNSGNTFINNGIITNTRNGDNALVTEGNVTSITNNGSITGSYSAFQNTNSGVINTFTNNGALTGTNDGIINSGTITNFINTSQISGSIGVYNSFIGTISTLTNMGMITGGVKNDSMMGMLFGTITTLNNSQGTTGSALAYIGKLPSNYNIIINGPTNYGQLAVTGGTGATNFGIYTGSTIANRTYTSVLSGIGNSNLTSLTGTYGSATWSLTPETACTTNCIYDLIISGYISPVTGPSIANTNQSLVNTASALQGTYTLQNSVLANSFSYDCTVFGANDVCVSAGGRNTTVQAANGLNNNSALLIAAYRPHPNYRIGAYADQNLSVSNPGGTVNLGNNTPLIGLFAAWNERLDGTGTEVKVSAAYGQKNTTMTRSVVGSGATASEAGSGSSTLNSQGTQLTAKYGFGILDNMIVSPYVGVRYTQNNMAGYTESTSSSVTAPLTYSALNTNATTALAGVGTSYRVIPQVMTFASAGVETDTNTANGTYSATNSSIGTLTPVNFNANPVKTRPTATVGAYYDIEKNQRVGITGIYRQEAYQAVSTTTVLATYTVGL